MKKGWLLLLSAFLAGCASDASKDEQITCTDGENGTTYFCEPTQMCGGGKCLEIDDENCGEPGLACVNGNVCDVATRACVCRSDGGKFCSLLCTASDGCVDPKTNVKHCGSENHACDTSKAEMCVGGECMDKCPSDYEKCGEMCADTENDADNCGACGNACPAAGTNNISRSYCRYGECNIVCQPDYFDEDEDISNGCELKVSNTCGNGIVEVGEACDGTKLNDQTCASLVGEGSRGQIYCSSDCRSFDTSECTPATTCGNGKLDGSEVCDGALIGNVTCADLRGEGSFGYVTCQANCAGYDASGCSAPTTCGNGKRDAGEDCDGTDLGGATCESVRGVGSAGTLKCASSCTFDISSCGMPSVCGNGILETGEKCDGSNFNGATCASLVGAGSTGDLVCESCGSISTAHCSAASTCGDNAIQGTEVCDGTALNNKTCADIVGEGSQGTLKCASNCGSFDVSGCTAPSTCGDGIINGREVCDGSKLNDQTCATQVGYGSTGTLRCNATCTGFDTALCSGSTTCGNGVLESNEVCDLDNVRGATCASRVGAGSVGTVTCGSDCSYLNLSGCSAATACGNGVLDAGEVCDNTKDAKLPTCAELVGEGSEGTVKCGDGCKHYDTTGCSKATLCGNNKLDGSEVCDGSALNNKTCADIVGYGSKGILSCNATCTAYDVSRCSAAQKCGNGVLDAGEKCDGTMLNGATCASQVGFGSTGTLVCNETCDGFITTNCSAKKTCGDGVLDLAGGEVCDGYNLNGATCADVVGYGSVGTPECNSKCTGFTRGTCTDAVKCGNGKIDSGEQCDGALLQGATCESVVGYGSTGTLSCDASCRYNTTNCTAAKTCGNGKLDDGEQCDGTEFINGIKYCNRYASEIYSSGKLACTSNCTIDFSACVAYCGNGEVNTSKNEVCDGDNFARGKDTCEKVVGTGSVGTLKCSSDCKTIETNSCTAAAVCGDGSINTAYEQCDGSAFKNGSADCSLYGDFEAGTNVSCLGNCLIDTSACVKKSKCGNGKIDGDEQCDQTAFYADVDTCAGYDPKTYASGALKCTSACTYDFSGCTKKTAVKNCGNNVVDDDELCDGTKFYEDNDSCAAYDPKSYSGGKLKCTDSCDIDESACVKISEPVCGNGTIDPGEVCDGKTFPSGITTCAKYDPSIYKSGKLACSADCKSIDFSACVAYCGDGTVNTTVGGVAINEECDSGRFKSSLNTCAKVVGTGSTGTLKCNDNCTIDASGCSQPETCGNNKVDGDEDCDGTDFLLDEKTCKGWSSVYESGNVSCNKDCTINFSACTAAKVAVCGDAKIDDGEECDRDALSADYGSWDCSIYGSEYTGTMTCDSTCKLNVSACTLKEVKTCGNNSLDDDEECDGSLFLAGEETCNGWDPKYASGTVSCNKDCTIDYSACKVNVCGDGYVYGDEWCDGNNFMTGLETCAKVSSNYTGGTLKCNADCTIDESGCTKKCGDGELDENEWCDPGKNGNALFQADADTCDDWVKGTTGTLGCTPTCEVDTTKCSAKPTAKCGDNEVNTSAEDCDGTAFLLGVTECKDYSSAYTSGKLRCTADCKYDLSGCVAPKCGDNVLDDNEYCDGDKFMFGIKTCAEYSSTYTSGLLKCTDKCAIDTSACLGAVCGNDILEDDEFCDTSKFIDDQDECAYWGDYASGKVTCTKNCQIDTAQCVKKAAAKCGDNEVNQESEDCDGTKFFADVTSCSDYSSKLYSGGSLKCTADCKYDFSGCAKVSEDKCGNNEVDDGEDCDGTKFYADVTACSDYSSSYNKGSLKCTSECRYDLSECQTIDACKDEEVMCGTDNALYMCEKSGTKPAVWVEMEKCATNKVCSVSELACIDKPLNFEWCTFHWLDATNRIGYGRVLMPEGKTDGDMLAYMACTNDLSKTLGQWDQVAASWNKSCSNCGPNQEYMTVAYASPKAGKNYCAFVFEFDNGMYVCKPQQTGAAAPEAVTVGSTIKESMTRSFDVATVCLNDDAKCDGTELYLCENNEWIDMGACAGDTPVCSEADKLCIAVPVVSYDNTVTFGDKTANANKTNYTNKLTYSFADGSSFAASNVAIYVKDHVIDAPSIVVKTDKGSTIAVTGLKTGIGTFSFDYLAWNASEPDVTITGTFGSKTESVTVSKTKTAKQTANWTINDATISEVTISVSGSKSGRAVLDNFRFTSAK